MEKPNVSVIVPIYNVEQYLKQCIESIQKQSLSNIEIILVDDGSKDNCGKICDEYAKRDSRIKVIHKENGGLVSARKAGLELATGNYVAYVDGDDFIEVNTYEVMYTKAASEEADIVIVGYLTDDGENQVCQTNIASTGVYRGMDLEGLYTEMIYSGRFYVPGIIPSLCTKLFKREKLYNCQMNVPNEIQMGEDVACSYQVILNSDIIVIDNEFCPYHYRYVATSMTKGIDESYFHRIFILYNYLRKCLKDEYDIEVQLEYYLAYLIRIGISHLYGKKSALNKQQKGVCTRKLEEEYAKQQNRIKVKFPWYIKIEQKLYTKRMYGALPIFLRISNWFMSLK